MPPEYDFMPIFPSPGFLQAVHDTVRDALIRSLGIPPLLVGPGKPPGPEPAQELTLDALKQLCEVPGEGAYEGLCFDSEGKFRVQRRSEN